MATISKTEKIRMKLLDLEKIEKTEMQIFEMAEKATSGDYSLFNISIKEVPPKTENQVKLTIDIDVEEYTQRLHGMIAHSFFRNEKTEEPKKSRLNLEISDNELLKFFGVYMDLLAVQKKNIIRSLSRLGVKI